jgi:hypothetical protein
LNEQAARIATLEEQMDDLGLSGYRQERSIDRDFSAISLRYRLLHMQLCGLTVSSCRDSTRKPRRHGRRQDAGVGDNAESPVGGTLKLAKHEEQHSLAQPSPSARASTLGADRFASHAMPLRCDASELFAAVLL